MLVRGEQRVVIDVTRHFPWQSQAIDRIDLVLLTHAHRDATAGVPRLAGRVERVPALAHPATIRRLRERYRRLDHLALIPIHPGEHGRWAGWTIRVVEIPHATDPQRFPTYAWRLDRGERVLVYASDVARLTPNLAALAEDATVLVLDGAAWSRPLPTHLQADRALPQVCGWRVERILLTQIGRSAPAHEELMERVAALCPRARPAYDGLVEPL